ncbi:hypothetical protein Lbir_2156 [Legionella birminghamensis]|uniref:Protein of uncharacterized function (DUF1189) n=1 Tax=Legionella birminghamensis TaxID=28083 RepID=A0A378IBN3_9GAMM|nr:DUF1189 family protein [Legionella birminghamensis]KTC69417.1 hypothetical protein Lbir_2156 [Legionella birminghamensis]STX31971.1 Protein of uncharacterised function (DUF1189) [Legionella birminghamensis]
MNQQNSALRDINKPHYNYWQALILSFFSNRLYVDVGKRWTGLGVLYLFIAILVFGTPFALRTTNDFNSFFNQQLLTPLRELPPITIQNGQVSTDKPMPYEIKNQQGQVVSVIDTTGTVTGRSEKYPYLTTLISKNQLSYWPPSPQFFFMNQAQPQSDQPIVQIFPPQMNEIFVGSKWIESSGIGTVKYLSLIIIYPTVILIFFVMFLTFFLVFGMIGQLVSKLFYKLDLTYPQSCRLLAVAATPAIAILLLILAINLPVPGFGVVIIIALAFYFSFAVISLRNESKKLVLS